MSFIDHPIAKFSPAAGAAIYVWNGHSFSTRANAEQYRQRILKQRKKHAELVALAAAKLDS